MALRAEEVEVNLVRTRGLCWRPSLRRREWIWVR